MGRCPRVRPQKPSGVGHAYYLSSLPWTDVIRAETVQSSPCFPAKVRSHFFAEIIVSSSAVVFLFQVSAAFRGFVKLHHQHSLFSSNTVLIRYCLSMPTRIKAVIKTQGYSASYRSLRLLLVKMFLRFISVSTFQFESFRVFLAF